MLDEAIDEGREQERGIVRSEMLRNCFGKADDVVRSRSRCQELFTATVPHLCPLELSILGHSLVVLHIRTYEARGYTSTGGRSQRVTVTFFIDL